METAYTRDSVAPPSPGGRIYKDGPWSYCANDVISAVVTGGSKLMRWIPSRGVNYQFANVQHLSWIAPAGFTGATSYLDYLLSLPVPDACDYGVGDTQWQSCEYRESFYPVSFKSDTITRTDFGLLECERSPIYYVRGPQTGMPIDNDADWALARAAYRLQTHLEWNKWDGDAEAATSGNALMYNGLNKILSIGYVKANAVGPGSCDYTDPIIAHGHHLTSPRLVANAIRRIVRMLRRTASSRQVPIREGDMVIVMNPTHWQYVADAVAMGALAQPLLEGVTFNIDMAGYEALLSRIMTQNESYDGVFPVDGVPVPVIVDDLIGQNVTKPSGRAAVIGHIYILTRFFGPLTILEHEYLDWTQLRSNNANPPMDEEIMQNGMLRTGWLTLNNKCYQYFVEMQGRFVSRFQPMQARITDVLIETDADNENVSGSYTSPDFYAYEGRRGGIGNDLLIGL